jgi:hypothetical protein
VTCPITGTIAPAREQVPSFTALAALSPSRRNFGIFIRPFGS